MEDAPQQGISPAPGVLLPHELEKWAAPGVQQVEATVREGSLELDALLVRPDVSRLVLDGGMRIELVHSAADRRMPVRVGGDAATTVSVYDADGSLVREVPRRGSGTIVLPAGGFVIAVG